MTTLLWYPNHIAAIGYKSDILTDTIAKDWKNGVPHVDIWTGGFQESEDGEKQIQCEEHLTPDEGQLVVRNPPHDLVANSECTPCPHESSSMKIVAHDTRQSSC